MKRKTIITIVIITVVLGGAVFYYLRSGKAKVKINTAQVERGEVMVAVTATGKINPVTTVQVGTQVSGTISKIYVDFNSHVKKGQVIAELDKTYLLSAVQDAQANLEKGQITADQAKREYLRSKQLFEEKVIARADYELAESNYKSAVSSLSSFKSMLNRAQINLAYATIKAPIDGVVISRNVDVGQTVAASFNTPTLFSIANDLTRMQVEASVDEADIGNIRQRQEVTFTVDAFPGETFTGTVKQIRLQPAVTQNVVTYAVIVEVGNAEQKLLPGMTANISVIIEKRDNVLKVSASALRFIPDPELLKDNMQLVPDSVKQKLMNNNGKGKNWGKGQGPGKGKGRGRRGRLWLKKGEQIVPVRVETGLTDGSYTEVKGDIKEGEEVVVSAVKEEKESSVQQKSPFMPQGPGRGGARRY